MARVTITDTQGVVETPGNGVVVSSATTHTGPLVGNAAVGSNDIVGVPQCVVGAEVTLATDATTTVSGAVSVPANCIIVGVALRGTVAGTIGSSANLGLNVGTVADGSGEQIAPFSGTNLVSANTAYWSIGSVMSSAGCGAPPEAGSHIPLTPNGVFYSATARSVYFKTTSSTGNPTAGKYIPMVYFVRIA